MNMKTEPLFCDEYLHAVRKYVVHLLVFLGILGDCSCVKISLNRSDWISSIQGKPKQSSSKWSLQMCTLLGRLAFSQTDLAIQTLATAVLISPFDTMDINCHTVHNVVLIQRIIEKFLAWLVTTNLS